MNSAITMKAQRALMRRLAEALSLAILLEASGTPKPGNVHRVFDRKALRYEAFLATGTLAQKYFEKGLKRGYRGSRGRALFGDLVYGVVREVRDFIRSSNTCLGSSLLLSFMSVSLGSCLRRGFSSLGELGECSKSLLEETTVWDTIYYYMAIRKASPSYLKPSDYTGDYVNVWDPHYRKRILEKGHRLVQVLKYSSSFDIVARELVSGFSWGIKAEGFLRSRVNEHFNWNRAVVETYLYILAHNIDTVVRLKHGLAVAEEVSRTASMILDEVLGLKRSAWMKPVFSFDNALRRRNINPGAVADLTAEAIALYIVRNILNGDPLLDLSR